MDVGHTGLEDGVHIALDGAGEAVDLGLGAHVHDLSEDVLLDLGGCGETGLHHVDAEVVEGRGYAHLVGCAEGDARSLLPVAERRIEETHPVGVGQGLERQLIVGADREHLPERTRVSTGLSIHTKHLKPSTI